MHFHAVENAIADGLARVPDECHLLPAMARTRQMLRRELAMLAPLLDDPPLGPVLAEGHSESWPRRVVQALLLVCRVVKEELYLSRVEVRSCVHEEITIIRKQPVLELVLRPDDMEAPELARPSQRVHELGHYLPRQALLHAVRDVEGALALQLVRVVVGLERRGRGSYRHSLLGGRPRHGPQPRHRGLLPEHHYVQGDTAGLAKQGARPALASKPTE
mmetsp:Transcript_32705/g.98894  ORF Transcript_32705/g.98894 Transcript_32705/m.98894 type:complete len:218 (-) Transcript_32705:22-675(-)